MKSHCKKFICLHFGLWFFLSFSHFLLPIDRRSKAHISRKLPSRIRPSIDGHFDWAGGSGRGNFLRSYLWLLYCKLHDLKMNSLFYRSEFIFHCIKWWCCPQISIIYWQRYIRAGSNNNTNRIGIRNWLFTVNEMCVHSMKFLPKLLAHHFFFLDRFIVVTVCKNSTLINKPFSHPQTWS